MQVILGRRNSNCCVVCKHWSYTGQDDLVCKCRRNKGVEPMKVTSWTDSCKHFEKVLKKGQVAQTTYPVSR